MKINKHKIPSILSFIEVFIGIYFIIIAIFETTAYVHDYNLTFNTYRPGTSAIGMSLTEDHSAAYMHLNDKWAAKRFVKAVKNSNGVLTELNYKDSKQTNPYLGTQSKYFSLFKPGLTCGRYFTQIENTKSVCVIGEGLAKKCFGSSKNSIGKKLKDKFLYNTYVCGKATDALVKKPLIPTIVGVLKSNKKIPVRVISYDNGNSLENFEVKTDFLIVYPISQKSEINGSGFSRTIWLKGDGRTAKKIVDRLSNFKEYFNFKINPQPSLYSGINTKDLVIGLGKMYFTYLLLAAIVIFGVSSIQLIAVKKRKFEIGLSIAVGARKRDIIHIILKDSSFKIIIPAITAFIAAYYTMAKNISLFSMHMMFNLYSCISIILAITIFIVLTSIIPAYYALNINVINVINKAKE